MTFQITSSEIGGTHLRLIHELTDLRGASNTAGRKPSRTGWTGRHLGRLVRESRHDDPDCLVFPDGTTAAINMAR